MNESALLLVAGGETRTIGRKSCLRCRALVSGRARLHICAGMGRRPSAQVRKRVSERDGWICQLCGDPVDPRLPHTHPYGATLDHRIPRVGGGLHGDDNLQLAHALCNHIRGHEPLEGADFDALREHIRVLFEPAFARYLQTHPHGRPEQVVATLERRRQKRREYKRRRRERRAAARMAELLNPVVTENVA